jgi:hypothetical protein
MANKLAGQRAKFTKALADYQRTDDENKKRGAARRMAEVLTEAPANGFTEIEVTQGAEIPDEVRRLVEGGINSNGPSSDDPDQLTEELQQTVDTSDFQETGDGNQCVYAYGYRCAPDRLKVGRSDGDVINRIARQISTGTPDKPTLVLVIRTGDCRGLEKAIQGVLQVRGRKIIGGGDEWYITTRDELLQIHTLIIGSSIPREFGD